MRASVIAGLFACAVVFFVVSGKTEAASLELMKINIPEPALQELLSAADIEELETVVVEEKPKQIEHKVIENETLSEIAKEYDTTWQRIYDKNLFIEVPDIINPGETVLIPEKDEVLEARALPVEENVIVQKTVNSATTTSSVASTTVGSSSGNGYVRGYCTWYVKNRRPDLPNNLGNAITWVSRASGQGLSTGSTPAVGAVGQQGNHVVYVESVNADGTVTVSEMNFTGWNVISTRTVSAGNFSYIY